MQLRSGELGQEILTEEASAARNGIADYKLRVVRVLVSLPEEIEGHFMAHAT